MIYVNPKRGRSTSFYRTSCSDDRESRRLPYSRPAPPARGGAARIGVSRPTRPSRRCAAPTERLALVTVPIERCELRGRGAQQPDSQRPEDGSAACSLSVISGWRDGVFFIPWRGVPTIPARRSLTGSGRRLAASPVLFREIAVFFLANDGARAIGANAASYGVAVRNSPIRNGPKMGLRRALSPSFPAGEMVCSLSLGGGCRRFRRGAV